VTHACPCRRLQDSSDAVQGEERCRAWHKSAMKGIARRRFAFARRGQRKILIPQPLASAHVPINFAAPQLAHSSPETYGFSATAMAPRLLFTGASHAHLCVLPRLPGRALFRNPDGLTESVPISTLLLQTADVSIHLRAWGIIKTQARGIWGVVCSHFLELSALWRSVPACNRIHRNGG